MRRNTRAGGKPTGTCGARSIAGCRQQGAVRKTRAETFFLLRSKRRTEEPWGLSKRKTPRNGVPGLKNPTNGSDKRRSVSPRTAPRVRALQLLAQPFKIRTEHPAAPRHFTGFAKDSSLGDAHSPSARFPGTARRPRGTAGRRLGRRAPSRQPTPSGLAGGRSPRPKPPSSLPCRMELGLGPLTGACAPPEGEQPGPAPVWDGDYTSQEPPRRCRK